MEAAQALHDRNIVHRDIKSANFMFVKAQINEEDAVRLVLGDLGLALKIGADNKVAKMDAGLFQYAPAIIFETEKHTKKTDVLFILNVAIALMYDTVPFGSSSEKRKAFETKVRKGEETSD